MIRRHLGVADREAAEDHEVCAEVQPGARRRRAAHPAAELHGGAGVAQHHDRGADGVAREHVGHPAGGVEVDDVEPLGALADELEHHLRRLLRVDRLVGEVTAEQPHAPATPHVGGGDDDHDCACCPGTGSTSDRPPSQIRTKLA